ncbi:Uncharacterised protein [Serratia fonticola]|uniref:Uncharacterized protein n=1 Tax=Serratia fonticola TaxID=47917 RepID=A0A4U9UHP7_SERFO|nr:Uncharacterised protein [Serratia fonticola]
MIPTTNTTLAAQAAVPANEPKPSAAAINAITKKYNAPSKHKPLLTMVIKISRLARPCWVRLKTADYSISGSTSQALAWELTLTVTDD